MYRKHQELFKRFSK